MPYSYSKYKREVREHILSVLEPSAKILDVGPGSGSYFELLGDSYQMDALEIFEPYVRMFNLSTKYSNLIIGDVREFDRAEYDYIIFGDVIEHLTVEDATRVLDSVKDKKYLVAVPFLFEQGEEFGNVHEIHYQPDLTEELVIQRYGLKKLYSDEKYGYFINYEF